MSAAVEQPATGETGPAAATRELLDSAGITGRRLRTAVRLLTEGPHTLAALVQRSGTDRRTVEALLRALGEDLAQTGDRMRIAASRVPDYRELIGYAQLLDTEPADPLGPRLARHGHLVARMERLIAEAPRPRHALDHVSATAETAVRRALWLDATFDLARARLLCAGDHDLTSLALALVNPDVEIAVADVDDAILGYIGAAGGPRIRCLWADFRFGVPGGLRDWADLVFTDPPYTPEGVGLFLARGLETLRGRDRARLVLAYGFSPTHPALGLKVQQSIAALQLACTAILPGFNRYDGAQAVGSRSDLYVLQPTARSFRTAGAGGRPAVNIYTHGAQSLEGEPARLPAEVAATVRAAAAGPADLPVTLAGPGWPAGDGMALSELFGGDTPARLRPGTAAAADLTGDPGAWLARALLTLDAPRLALLVPNQHPDLANAEAQHALTGLVAAKYRLKLRRSTPTSRHAVVEADLIPAAGLDGPQRVVREVLGRAHGKVGNTWREALIRLARAEGTSLTKNEARARIAATPVPPELLAERLLDLPRHQLQDVLYAIAQSARAHPG